MLTTEDLKRLRDKPEESEEARRMAAELLAIRALLAKHRDKMSDADKAELDKYKVDR